MKKVNVGDTVRITKFEGELIDPPVIRTITEVDEDIELATLDSPVTVDFVETAILLELEDGDNGDEFEIIPKVSDGIFAGQITAGVWNPADIVADTVDHPGHYTQGKFETIEVIEEITKGYDDGFVAYSVGNALKYLSRAPHKHESPAEDLRKAAKYIEFALDHIED